VSPRITEVGIQAPLGVQSNTFPSWSITEMCVVSLVMPAVGSASAGGWLWVVASAMLATQYFQALTFESNGNGFPARDPRGACFGSICLARSFAYALESSPSAGDSTNAGSA